MMLDTCHTVSKRNNFFAPQNFRIFSSNFVIEFTQKPVFLRGGEFSLSAIVCLFVGYMNTPALFLRASVLHLSITITNHISILQSITI